MANHQYDALITNLGAGALGLVALAAWYWNRENRWRRRLAKLRTTLVGDANEGLVKLVGTVHPIAGTVGAPFSGRPCVGFEVVATDMGRKNSPQIFAERHVPDFLLRDESGEAIVRSAETDFYLDIDARFSSGLFSEAEPRIRRYLNDSGVSTKGLFLDKRLSCTEGILEVGERVVVCGHVRRQIEADPAKVSEYREVPTRVVVSGKRGAPMLISDQRELVDAGPPNP